jgi:hypothetical protein
VSNITGSVPNGKKRWGGGRHSDRFIPLDHPHPPGPDAHRPRGRQNIQGTFLQAALFFSDV